MTKEQFDEMMARSVAQACAVTAYNRVDEGIDPSVKKRRCAKLHIWHGFVQYFQLNQIFFYVRMKNEKDVWKEVAMPWRGGKYLVLTIHQFQQMNTPESIVMTLHSRRRLSERGISIQDVCNAIDSGTIIEEYPEDDPFPSCLILGMSEDRYLHVVASIDENHIYLITSYRPDPARWESDGRTRRKDRE